MSIATPPDDDGHAARANVFFDRGRTVAGTGNFEYGIEQYIQGLNLDPENIEAHRALRQISLERTAQGGGDLGLIEKMKLRTKGHDRQSMLDCEKLLAYNPANPDRMRAVLNAARAAGMSTTATWIEAILRQLDG